MMLKRIKEFLEDIVVNYTDRDLSCLDCNTDFTFSSDDQSFHAAKGYSDPKRCPNCRKAARTARNSGGGNRGGGGCFSRDRGPRELFSIQCSDCNKEAKVPFNPSGDRPVYCSECFDSHK